MRITAGFALLVIGAASLLLAKDVTVPKKHVPVKMIGPGNNFPGQIWGQTYFPPLLSFRLQAGKIPLPGATTLCEVLTERRAQENKSYTTISLHCEEGLTMELEGIDLQGGGQ